MTHFWQRWWWLLLLGVILAGYWLLPISGRMLVITGRDADWPWPQLLMQPIAPEPGQPTTVWVTDNTPWPHVLLTVAGAPATYETSYANLNGTWTWRWTFTAPANDAYPVIFYRDCDTGCQQRGQLAVGAAPQPPEGLTPTKLGVVFADPQRNWHGRLGWAIDLTYAHPADDKTWDIDHLAQRVQQHTTNGLRVLVRIDYGPRQSLPPLDDHLALAEYLAAVRRLARDDRLKEVYGFIIGSDFNALAGNTLSPHRPVNPAWYARVFNGSGQPPHHTDNVVQIIRAENPNARVLVGPVQPWNTDQNGERLYQIDAPWLNYFHTVLALLDENAQAKASVGFPFAAPDGFAVQAPGRLTAPEINPNNAAAEPRLDLYRDDWNGAQAGFRVYRDWLAVINQFSTTQGQPIYITAANTFTPDEQIPPAQNYPAGWLTTALDVVNQEPQVNALCWFMDGLPGDTQWLWFSLTQPSGKLVDAAEEFDALLQEDLYD